jgi:peroxiredoxin
LPDEHSCIRAGDRAPEFVLPAADRDGDVSLRDCLDRSPVFLGLFRGLYCAFCRRSIASLARLGTQLGPLGMQTFGVVATPTHHARLYFKHHPVPMTLAADPAMTTHAAYGLPKVPKEGWPTFRSTPINPTGELREPLPIPEANQALGQLDLFAPAQTDREDMLRTWNQLTGLFLIDRTGIVRWVFVEAVDGLASIGRYPAEAELVTVARTMLQ